MFIQRVVYVLALVLVLGCGTQQTFASPSSAATTKITLRPNYFSAITIPPETPRGIRRTESLLCVSSLPKNIVLTATAREIAQKSAKKLALTTGFVRKEIKSTQREIKKTVPTKKKKTLTNYVTWLRFLNSAITECTGTEFPTITPPTGSPTPESVPTSGPNGGEPPSFLETPTPIPTPSGTATPTATPNLTPTPTPTRRPSNTPGPAAPTLEGNCISLTEVSGRSNASAPIQIGRPFVRGEIMNFPIAVVNGTPVQTQADVKTRWPDGSVAHAILSFYITTSVAERHTVCFQNQTSGMNDQFLTQPQMLAPQYNFDARTQLTSPVSNQSVSASARTALSNNKFSYWLKGRNATSILLADHSTERSLDLGFDVHRSFRPTWEATFYPIANLVRIRVNGEISNSEAVQDMTYHLAVSLGLNSPQIVLQRSALKQHAFATWSREFWLGSAPPPEFSINHNIRYLAQTGFIPNYDPTISVSAAAIDSEYNSWYNTPRDLNDAGHWTISMPAPGGRREIGPVPSWVAYWLYSGDIRMAEYSMRQAELAGNWPMNLREGDSTKYFDSEQTVPGLGLPLSPINRVGLMLWDDNYGITQFPVQGSEGLDIVGTRTTDGWTADGAHQPDPFSTVYTLTGEHWFFERLFHWAMWGRFHKHGSNISNGRGPNGWSINDQWRADAWLFRARFLAAFLCPDNHVAKADLQRSVIEAIAIWEGMRNITGTTLQSSSSWVWGNTVGRTGQGSSNGNDRGIFGSYGIAHTNPPRYVQAQALHFWKNGEGIVVPGHVISSVNAVGLPWQANFIIHVLARAEELGYPTLALKGWIGQHTTQQLLDPSYEPTLSAQYYTPESTTTTIPESIFQTLSAVRNAYTPAQLGDANNYFYSALGDTNHGYPIIMRAAVQSLTNISSGPQAQAVVDALLVGTTIPYSSNPKWAIQRRQ